MGTNFYIYTKDRAFADTYFAGEYTNVSSSVKRIFDANVDTCEGVCEIHIGKRSIGWKPLFQVHAKAYSSVKEMLAFLNEHKDKVSIANEYGVPLTIDQLKEELVDWGECKEHTYYKYSQKGVPDEIFGGIKHLIESTKEDYDIATPFDHIEYIKFEALSIINLHYTHDPDGYDFVDREFS